MLRRVLTLQTQSLCGVGTPFPMELTEKPHYDGVRILLSEVRETGSTVLGMPDRRGTLQPTQGFMLHPP